jgi:GT2 family glycosyltransferase
VPLTAAVTACHRTTQLHHTLSTLSACNPPPREILVHVDGASPEVIDLLRQSHPEVKILSSPSSIGPGGARNHLNNEASCDWIAHFDDDSFPASPDYFAKAQDVINTFPTAAAFAALFPSHPADLPPPPFLNVAAFIGCGHLINKSWFEKTHGYVPRPLAYNIEEVDVCLQLHALGGLCIQASALQVWHDHSFANRPTDPIAIATLANTFLFPLIRFPLLLLPLGLFMGLRRSLSVIRQGNSHILLPALADLLKALPLLDAHRAPVSTPAVLSWLRLRRQPQPLSTVPNAPSE